MARPGSASDDAAHPRARGCVPILPAGQMHRPSACAGTGSVRLLPGPSAVRHHFPPVGRSDDPSYRVLPDRESSGPHGHEQAQSQPSLVTHLAALP